MKKTKLGEFEELVLMTVVVLQEEAYGVEIKESLKKGSMKHSVWVPFSQH